MTETAVVQSQSKGNAGWTWAQGVLVLAVFALALSLQMVIWPLNPDTSWLLTVIDRMHAGDRLYLDIIETNPPFSVWLYMLPARLAYLAGVAPELLVRLYVAAICLWSVGLTGWILRDSRLLPAKSVSPAVLILLLTTTVLTGETFTGRDHIGAVAVLPLMVLAAWRVEDGSPQRRYWLAAGVSGGIIALTKPYYAIVIVVAAAWIAATKRDWRAFMLPEFVVAGSMSLAYTAIAYLVHPVFFFELLPLLRVTYMAFKWPAVLLAAQVLPWLGLPIAYCLLARYGGRTSLTDLLLIAGATGWIPYFIQGKGWAYHSYPATLLATGAVVFSVCRLVFGGSEWSGRNSLPAGTILVTAVAVLAAHAKFFPGDAPSRALANEIRTQVSSPSVGILGGDIAFGHPLTREIDGRWIEPYCSDWLAIYALRLEREAVAAGNLRRASHYADMFERYLAGKLDRLRKAPPDILIVDRAGGLVHMMLAEHGFANLLSRYAKMAGEDDLEVYRLLPSS